MRAIHPIGAMLVSSLLFFCTLTIQAKIAVIETHSGRIMEGELLSETDDKVTLRISNIETPISRTDIKSMTLRQTPEEVYAERRAKLADDDMDGRWSLAYDLFEMGALSLAKREADALVRSFPNEDKVKRLSVVINDAIQTRQDQQAGSRPPAPPSAAGTTPPKPAAEESAATSGSLREMQLTDEQINLIRLWELPEDLDAAQPRIIIPSETIKKLLEEYASNDLVPKSRERQNDFRRAEGYEQLKLIFQLKAREYYKDVRVVEDPPVMLEYRRAIAPLYVNTYFYRTFGRGQVPGLYLFGGRGDKVRAAYTDFYILTNFRPAPDQVMIDRQDPSRSLLVQWGLPRNLASYPAPDVPGWRPFFANTEDPKFRQVVDWINSLYQSPDYGISYTAPKHEVPESAGE